MLSGRLFPKKATAEVRREKMNILFITLDDLNYNSLGITGSSVKNISPNIDKLREDSFFFDKAHVTIAVCQPSRQVMMTGKFPHNMGATGFEPIDPSHTTLQEVLRDNGYRNGILHKVKHLAPASKFPWDLKVGSDQLGMARDPEKFYQTVKRFINKSKKQSKPFFLMVNSADPHRPFATSNSEKKKARARGHSVPTVDKVYKPSEIEVPGFLPDIPKVRKEVAQYYTSVHRGDQVIGRTIDALKESGLYNKTIIVLLSDNGMAFPYAKTNVYLNSTKTPLLIRVPGMTEAGGIDREHFVSGVDMMPTLLDLVGIKGDLKLDGRSFAPLLKGQKQNGRDVVFTYMYKTVRGKAYPMRAIVDEENAYIYNDWADNVKIFKNESQSGMTWKAMVAASESNEEIRNRVRIFQHRIPHEFYDLDKDPDALNNLYDRSKFSSKIETMKRRLLTHMKETKDPLFGSFKRQVP